MLKQVIIEVLGKRRELNKENVAQAFVEILGKSDMKQTKIGQSYLEILGKSQPKLHATQKYIEILGKG